MPMLKLELRVRREAYDRLARVSDFADALMDAGRAHESHGVMTAYHSMVERMDRHEYAMVAVIAKRVLGDPA